MARRLGARLRSLRKKKAKSLKQAAPELGLSSSFLSKLENDKVAPSPETIERLAAYYTADGDELEVLAGRLPEDVMDILQNRPAEAIALLRETFRRG